MENNYDSGSFLKKLKGIFVVEDAIPSQNTTNTPTPASPTPQATLPVFSPPTIVTSTGQQSDKFMNLLLQSLETNNPVGFDYFEFRQSILNLAKMPMDESTRYQSAYAMAQTMGVTSQSLIQSASNYVAILAGEDKKFHDALANQQNTNVGAKQQEISNLDAAIKQKAAQIKELTDQIQQNQQQMETLKSQINEASSKVETTKNDFVVTYNALVGEIKRDIDNMQRYLK